MTSPHFEKPISDLRRRMLQDMTNRNFGDKTKHDYIRQVEALAKFLDRSPDTVTGDELRRFQADQIARGAQPPKMNSQASALRFFNHARAADIRCGSSRRSLPAASQGTRLNPKESTAHDIVGAPTIHPTRAIAVSQRWCSADCARSSPMERTISPIPSC